MKPRDLSTFRYGPPAALPLAAWLPNMAALAVLLAVPLAPLRAQFRSNVNLVDVYVSVQDSKGAVVESLSKDDFVVFEDGVAQPVSVFTPGKVPLSLALALDRSFSVAGARLEQMKRAAAGLFARLEPQDCVLLLGVGSTVDVLAPLDGDRRSLSQALSRVDAFGSTSLHDAIVTAIDRIQAAPGRRALVLLSDGVDRYSQASMADVVGHAKSHDVLIFPIAVGAPLPSLFTELAAVTGGRAFEARDRAALDATLGSLASLLRAQYLLGYTPVRAAAGARAWRRIRVEVRRPGVVVSARQGYWTQ